MKKIITLVLAVVMIAAVAATCVSADVHYVWSHNGDFVEDPFNDTTRVGHDSPLTATIKFKTDVGFNSIRFPKIWATPHAEVTVEVLSGETVKASKTVELLNEGNGSGDVETVDFDLGSELPAGEYTMRISVPEGFYAFLAYGKDPLPDTYIEYERGHAMFGLYTGQEGSGFVDMGVQLSEKLVPIFEEAAAGDPYPLLNGPLAIVITVPTGYKLAEIIGSNSPTWSNQGGGSSAKVEIYKWAGSYDDSVDGAVLAKAEVIDHVDNQDAAFVLDKQLSAGTYLAEFSAIGDMNIGFWTSSAVEGDHSTYINGTEESKFYPKAKLKLVINDGQEQSTDPGTTTGTDPVTPPPTSDAAIAVAAFAAVAAVGASVVVIKKKSYR